MGVDPLVGTGPLWFVLRCTHSSSPWQPGCCMHIQLLDVCLQDGCVLLNCHLDLTHNLPSREKPDKCFARHFQLAGSGLQEEPRCRNHHVPPRVDVFKQQAVTCPLFLLVSPTQQSQTLRYGGWKVERMMKRRNMCSSSAARKLP